MNKQRGISFLGIIGGILLMLFSFTAGSKLQADADMGDLDALLADACDTGSNSTGLLLSSSDKYYHCRFVRNMTPVEIAERKRRVDQANGRKPRKVDGEQPASAAPAPNAADPEETREK